MRQRLSDRLRSMLGPNFTDPLFQVRGSLRVDIWRGPAFTGEHVGTPVNDPNLVVTLARKTMSRLLSGCAGSPVTVVKTSGGSIAVTGHPEYLHVTKMKFGSGGHNPSTLLPLTPSVTDEDLEAVIPVTTGVYHKAVTVEYPTEYSVRFIAVLEQSEANGSGGQIISEEGLYCTGTGATDFLFARRCFGILTKTSELSFSFTHTILF